MTTKTRKWRRKDGSYGKAHQAYVVVDGKKVRIQKRTAAEAKLVEAEMRLSGLNGKYSPEARKTTVKDLAVGFLKKLENTNKFSGSYSRHLASVIRNYVIGGPAEMRGAACAVKFWEADQGLGSIKLHLLTRGRIMEFMDRLQAAGGTHSVRSDALGAIKSLIVYALDRDLMDSNPVDGIWVKKTKEEFVGPVIIPELEHVDLMIEVANPIQRLLVVLSASTALRVGELMALKWSDLDLSKGVVNVEHTLSDDEGIVRVKSEKGIRSAPITERAAEEIANYVKSVGEDSLGEFVFENDGKPHTRASFTRLVSSLLTAAEEFQMAHPDKYPPLSAGITWKAMRHLGISVWLHARFHPVAVQLMAGHSNLRSIERTYGHVLRSVDQLQGLSRADAILFGTGPAGRPLIDGNAVAIEMSPADDQQLLLPL